MSTADAAFSPSVMTFLSFRAVYWGTILQATYQQQSASGKLSILVDGYNLGLTHGTGVATYGRAISKIYKQLGHSVSVLYGGRSTRSKVSLLSEVAFFDANIPNSMGPLKYFRILPEAYTAQYGCRVDSIPISGQVVFDSMKSRLPDFDELANSPELFLRCHRSFRWFGRFGQVSIPGLDVAHWTYPLPVRAKGAANIYTIHDLVPLRLPHTTLDNKRRYYKLCKTLVDTADHIITVSETSRKDIIDILDADPAKVTNTFQSVSFPRALLQKPERAVRDELAGIFNLSYKGYFLFFGAVEPKKNLGRLLEAYLASNVQTPLVIVGAPGWKSEEELKLLGNPKAGFTLAAVRKRVIRLEYLPLAMLMSLIRGARATLFPSLYEGFGLPVLESMLLGTAVLTSNTSSLPEVAGDAACLVDPYDTQAIAEGIRALDSNDELRAELAERGLRRARLFSEEAYAERLAEVYRRLGFRQPPASASSSAVQEVVPHERYARVAGSR
jgi:glycosyltransferase involved in cell wall biosynthesis